jgi:ferredoxin
MARLITQECIACGLCEPECPNDAISLEDSLYVVDSWLCTECIGFFETPQCGTVCPVDCIEDDQTVRETEAELWEKAKSLHPEKFPTD